MVLPASLSQRRGEWTSSRPHRWTALALVRLLPLGLYTKVYAGPAAAWVNHSLGGVFYVLFGGLLGFWFLPRARSGRIALAVLAVTYLLEFLQRWHPPWLEWLRSVWIGQILLGTTFAGSDFPTISSVPDWAGGSGDFLRRGLTVDPAYSSARGAAGR